VRPRLGIVAQAIGVVALGSLVYLAFLSPEDPDPLTGIEIEDGVRIDPPRFTTNGGRQGRPDQQGRPDKPKRARPRRPAALPRLVPTPPPSFEPVVTEPVVTEPVDTPSGVQYADGVARIMGRVASARP
jgi:hypothetical protein